MSEEERPARKIKPPSASFLKSKEVSSSAEGMLAIPDSAEGPLGAPSVEESGDDLFRQPDPGAEPKAVVARPQTVGTPAEAPRVELAVADRLAAEVRELRDIVNSVESLDYLRARVGRAVDEGADALSIVSFYRLVVRSLAEQSEQARRDFEIMRSKASKLELELATSLADGAVSDAPKAVATGISADAQARIGKLEQELAQAKEQREKLLFDFKNQRERTQKDLDIGVFRAKEKFFKNFLPVLDSFERAQLSLTENSSVASLLEGFRLIGTQLMEALLAEGLEAIDASGPFDPRFHEAVGEVDNIQKPDNDIFDELCRGYRLGERVIRAAMVRTSRNPGGVIVPPPAES